MTDRVLLEDGTSLLLLEDGSSSLLLESATSAQTVVVGLVTETDSVFSASALKAASIGLITETNSVFSVGHLKTAFVGLIVETDTVLAAIAPSGDSPPTNPWYEGKTVLILSDITGMREWEDYIPVTASPSNPGRFDNDGALPIVAVLTDSGGGTAWVDYIPVYIVSRTTPWSTDADGYIPIERTS